MLQLKGAKKVQKRKTRTAQFNFRRHDMYMLLPEEDLFGKNGKTCGLAHI